MSLVGKNEKKQKVLAPTGLQKVRCIHVIDMGTQENNYKGSKYSDHQVKLTFELSETLHVFREENGEEPFCVSPFPFSSNLGSKKTKAFFEGWLGREFTDEEKKNGFDFASMLGKAGMANIIHSAKKSDPSSKNDAIGSLSPMIKGSKMVKAVNPFICYSIGAADQWTEFEKIGKYWKEKIMTSPEWKSEATKAKYNEAEGGVSQQVDESFAEEPEEDVF